LSTLPKSHSRTHSFNICCFSQVKKDYLEGVGDTLDLVPIGGYHGRGKRTGVYGAYLMACYDPDTEEYQSICKIGTGFSDEALESLAASLNENKLDAPPKYYKYPDSLECDVWFSPCQVCLLSCER
jgi:DNA ligase-1